MTGLLLPKSASELFSEVKNFDLVLTSDVTLAQMINEEIKTSRIGKLCFSTKELSGKNFSNVILDTPEIVLEISNKLKLDLKDVHNAIEKIQEIEKHTELVVDFLKNDEIKIYELYKDLPTINKSFKEFNKKILPNRVAAIEPDFFNHLEKKLLPKEYSKINILKSETYNLSNFHGFSSEEQLIEKAVSLITPENANDFAIILNKENSILNSIKAKLYQKGVSIKEKVLISENLNIRSFLNLIQISLGINESTVKEIRPFLELFDLSIPYNYNNFILKKYIENVSEDEKVKEFFFFLEKISEKTYSDYLELFSEVELPSEIEDVLKKLKLMNAKISINNFSKLKYYISNFPIAINSSKKGVEIISCKSKTFVNKPICLYLNPDFEWVRKIRTSEYINKDNSLTNNIRKFQILFHQGQAQIYFAQLIKDNEKNIPCFYFNQIFGKEVKDFLDESFSASKHDYQTKELEILNNFKLNHKFNFRFFSQSSLNTFFECPKKYEFSRIAPKEEQTYFMKGTLLHEFAEFYVNYPEFCIKNGDDFFADILMEKFFDLIDSENETIEKTQFLIGIKNIKAYIDSLKLDTEHNLGNKESLKSDKNYISKKLNMPLKINNTEVYFENFNTKLRGFIDLVIDSLKVVDYKSSKTIKTIGKIVSKSNLDLIEDEADFQPLVYLLELSKQNPGKKLAFYYYFFLNNYKDVIGKKEDFTNNIIKIEYLPKSFNDFIISEEGLNILCSSKDRKEYYELMGSDIIEIFKENPIKDFVNIEESDAYKKLKEKVLAIPGKGEKGRLSKHQSFFNQIRNIKIGKNSKTARFFKEDLDKFEKFVNEEYLKVCRYIETGFPREPKSKKICDNCEFKDICFGRIEE